MSRNSVVEVSRAVVELSAVVVDDAGLVLLVRRGNELGLPCGPLLVGETAAAGVSRVVAEVTGVSVQVRDLVGVTSSPGFGVCFRARPEDGALVEHAEWVEPEGLAGLAVCRESRQRIEHVLAERAAYFG